MEFKRCRVHLLIFFLCIILLLSLARAVECPSRCSNLEPINSNINPPFTETYLCADSGYNCCSPGGVCECIEGGKNSISINVPDCAMSAWAGQLIAMDGGSFSVGGYNLDKGCRAGNPDVDDYQLLKALRQGTVNKVEAKITNMVGWQGRSHLRLRVDYGQPDSSQDLCIGEGSLKPCDTACSFKVLAVSPPTLWFGADVVGGGTTIVGTDDWIVWCAKTTTEQPRVWLSDYENNACCGDDLYDAPYAYKIAEGEFTPGKEEWAKVWTSVWPNPETGAGNSIFQLDSPDMSEQACTTCKLGANLGSRIWDPSLPSPLQCCGDNFELKVKFNAECENGETNSNEGIPLNIDNPDNSELHCDACPKTPDGADLGPGGRKFVENAQIDPRNFPAGGGCAEDSFEVNCNTFGKVPDWETEMDEYSSGKWTQKVGCGSPSEQVGCCGDDSSEKWCLGFKRENNGACTDGKIVAPRVGASVAGVAGEVDIDDPSTDGFACRICTIRSTGTLVKAGYWYSGVGPFLTLIGAPSLGNSPGGVTLPARPYEVIPQNCCGDDIGTDNWCFNDEEGCLAEGDKISYDGSPAKNAYLCLGCDDYGPTKRDWRDDVSADNPGEIKGCCGYLYDGHIDIGLVSKKTGKVTEADCMKRPEDSDFICGNFHSDTQWSWQHAELHNGEILHSYCNALGVENDVSDDGWEILSYGSQWAICSEGGFIGTELLEPENIGAGSYLLKDIGPQANDYLCVNGPGKETIYECCGYGACSSSTSPYGAGVRYQLGDVVHLEQGEEPGWYYCTSNGDWSRDLDTYDEITCESAKSPGGGNAGFTWTGTLCCGELDDVPEYYNDNGSYVGACWDSELVPNRDAITKNEETGLGDIVVSTGVFHGCAVEASNFNSNNDGYAYIPDTHTALPVVNPHPYCSNVYFSSFGGKLWCSYKEEWMHPYPLPLRPWLSTIIWQDNQSQASECCPDANCWIGKYENGNIGSLPITDGCVGNMSKYSSTEYAYMASDNNTYRCIDGLWENSSVKTSPYGDPGYCPKADMCLRDPKSGKFTQNGNTSKSARPLCLYNGQFKEDEDWYCSNGEWYSRTAKIAEELAKIPAHDATIACGTQQEMLNFVDYMITGLDTEEQNNVKEFLSLANNACVYIGDGSVAFGISLKQAPDYGYLPFLFVLNKTLDYCDGVADDNSFHACNAGDVYYNKKLNSVIYSPDHISFTSTSLFSSFQNEIVALKGQAAAVNTKAYGSYDMFPKIRYHNSIYMRKTDSMQIAGIFEAPHTPAKGTVMGISYSGVSTDLCAYTSKYIADNAKVYCKQEGQKAYILNNQEKVIGNIFSSFTYRLRLP